MNFHSTRKSCSSSLDETHRVESPGLGMEKNKVQKAYKNIGKGVHLHLMNHSESRES